MRYVVLLMMCGMVGAAVWGCDSIKRCATNQDCESTHQCIGRQCVPAQTWEDPGKPEQPTKDSTEPPEPQAEPTSPDDAGTQSEPAPEPTPEPTAEPASEPQPEPSPDGGPSDGDQTEPTAEPTADGGTEPTPELPPDGVGTTCLRPEQCPQGLICTGAKCQVKPECTTDLECTARPYFSKCVKGYCTPEQPKCRVDGECLIGTVCHEGTCLPGVPKSGCSHRSDCPANYNCEKGQCVRQNLTPPVQCSKPTECRSWETCYRNLCVRKCTTSKECPSTSVPQCNGGICVNPNLPPGVCNSDSDCLPRQYCSANKCLTCKAKPDCTQDSDCKSGESCLNGQCGIQCTRDTDCPRGFNICSQGMCRGDGYNPVGCPEDTEICDLVISKVTCIGGGRMTVTVQNVGIGPAVGRFYLCHEPQGSTKGGCQGAIIMNYGTGGNILGARATTSVTVSWRAKPGDILAVDRPNIILEASEVNNLFQVTQSCP